MLMVVFLSLSLLCFFNGTKLNCLHYFHVLLNLIVLGIFICRFYWLDQLEILESYSLSMSCLTLNLKWTCRNIRSWKHERETVMSPLCLWFENMEGKYGIVKNRKPSLLWHWLFTWIRHQTNFSIKFSSSLNR